MKKIKIIILAIFTSIGVNSLNAQDANNPWALSFGINTVDVSSAGLANPISALKDYVAPFGDSNTLPAISRISVSRYIDNGFSIELAGALNKLSKGVNGDLDDLSFFSIDVNGKYDLNSLSFIGETGWFDPYVGFGLGYTTIDEDGGITLNPTLGFNTWFNKNLGLNFQSSYKSAILGDGISTLSNDVYFQHSIGLAIRFGGTDSDGDGVFDNKDLCPNEAGLAKFNGCPDSDNDGIVDADDKCPNEAGIAAFGGCPDSDGDGVENSKDKCPNAKGTAANGGCPDADNDGVIDSVDKCPNVAGPKANKGCAWPDTDGDGVLDKDDKCINQAGPASNNGCAELTVEAVKKLGDFAKTINFNSGRTTFKSGVTSQLDGVVSIMKEFVGVQFNINGYTDSSGSKTKNLELSKLRASAVKDYLVSKGIAAGRLTSKGYGIDNPIASNKTAAGRAANRRVELVAKK
ncbi:OmpA family protein [Flavicella sediminum]|uniref:OmpA family protein n=1 Tax=Flavicella sediminum TaxID=2585141 RepID=UPI00111EC082|nr:OmpA family protein [Flavicella sediminum]